MKPYTNDWPDPHRIGAKYDEIINSQDFQTKINNIKYNPEFLISSRDVDADILKIRSNLLCRRLASELNLNYRFGEWGSLAITRL